MELYDCRSLIEIEAGDECLGGVGGCALSEEGEATGNVFVSDALHGIDGISYTGGAERVPFASLKALEGVPSEFLDLKLVFSADGQVIKTIHFEYGDSIDVSEIPAVPEKEGYTGAWPELDYERVTFSRTLEAVYTPLDTSVASAEVRGDGVQAWCWWRAASGRARAWRRRCSPAARRRRTRPPSAAAQSRWRS